MVRMGEDKWDELRRGVAIRAGMVVSGVAWVFLFVELGRRVESLSLISLTLAMAVIIPVIALYGRLSATAIGVGQVLLTLGSIWASHSLLGFPEAAAFLAVPLLLAAFLLPWYLATPVMIGIAGVALAWPALGPIPPEIHSLALALLGGVALVAVTLSRGFLRDAWTEAAHGARLAREVRLRQEEVNRLNKALKVSNGLLKRSLGELALAQREAEEGRHLKEQFATTVSHELRTPLNIILGFVEVMQRYPEVYAGAVWTPALRRDVGEIQRSARYLSELVDDILDLARVQALKMPIHREHHDLAAIIEEAVDLASRLLVDKRAVRIRHEVSPEVHTLFVDRTRIRQVLLNLLANACRFTDQGEIAVSAVRQGEEVVISVVDTGSGIPAEELHRIFDEFRQVTGPGDEALRSAGKGLGLAIARRFVQMHGGRMWVESEVGRGSTFYFSLPVEEKQVARLANHPVTEMSSGETSPSILVVDEPEGEAFLRRHLEQYRVIRAVDLTEAKELVIREHPRAVIVNVSAGPEEGPVGLPAALMSEPVPVLQCCLPGGRSLFERHLYDDWLVKPVDSDGLAMALGRFPQLRRILVVDDDPSFVRLVRRIIEAQQGDWEVDWAHDGREALDKLAQEPADIVLLDIALPGMSGRAVAQAIRRQFSDQVTAVIAVTAHQPGMEDRERQAHGFSVTTASGLSEDDTLNLIRACLVHLKPSYAIPPLGGEPEAVAGEKPA